jgi:hypothetical protein
LKNADGLEGEIFQATEGIVATSSAKVEIEPGLRAKREVNGYSGVGMSPTDRKALRMPDSKFPSCEHM